MVVVRSRKGEVSQSANLSAERERERVCERERAEEDRRRLQPGWREERIEGICAF